MKTVAFALLVVLACGLSAFGQRLASSPATTIISVPDSLAESTTKPSQNFSYSTAGTNQMPASSITVNPITTPFNPGFLFNAPWGVQAGQTQDSLIGFTVTVNPGGNLDQRS